MIQHYQYNVRHIDATRYLERLAHEDYTVIIKTCWRLEIFRGEGVVPVEVVRHLYRVVSGLDSPVLGDSAIQNQVKTAYQQACKQRKLDKFMHKLFQTALRTGKLVRSQTNISRGSVSYANAMYHIVAHKEQVPLDTPIVIVGVNDITRNVLRFLIKKGYRRIILLNRTLSRAEKMAKEFGIAYGPLSELQVALLGAGVLIAAAAAPEHVIGYEMFSPRPYVVVDVGVPPNVDQKILQCMNIVYYGIDSIENQINSAFSFRQKESEAANYIIETMVREFMQWQEAEIRRSVNGQVYLAANV